MTRADVSVIIGPRVRNHLAGGSLFQEPDNVDQHGYGTTGRQLVDAVDNTKTTRHVNLSRDEAFVLAECVDYMLAASRDDASWSPDAKADVASAKRVLRALAQQGVQL